MHQDNKYTCEAVSNGRTLIHTIKLVVEGWFHNRRNSFCDLFTLTVTKIVVAIPFVVVF